MKKDTKLYNVLFPAWLLVLFPQTWIAVLPGNFLMDSLVLWLSMKIRKTPNRKAMYKKTILPVFLFGLLADAIAAGAMLSFALFFEMSGEERYLTVPGVLVAAALIFLFDYFVSFRKTEKRERMAFSLIFAIFTAPYTFLIPTAWLYR